MKTIVIGAGPSGMMAAITASENGNDVILLEKMQTLGKKLLITGKGRCNITSSLEIKDFIKNTPGNGMFLYSVYNNYTNNDIIKFLNENGLKVKEERGNRYFPVTDKALDVLKCFSKRLKELKVEIICNKKVDEILIEKNTVIGVKCGKEILKADKVILATGGKSYPLTGSTGDGYIMAKKIGHNITNIKPSLVPLEIHDKHLCSLLQGLSLKNVEINIIDSNKNKVIYNDFGEMLFTHYGVSGPIILSGSSHIVRYKNIEELLKNKKIILKIDFKPSLTNEILDKRILRDFQELKNKQFKNALDKLLPQKLIPAIIEKVEINKETLVNEITKEQRKRIVEVLKNFEIEINGFRPIEEAIITSGGINVKEINPKTMESKIINNLFFAGEIIDVDSYTGGFNLQIAYSTGFVAGSN